MDIAFIQARDKNIIEINTHLTYPGSNFHKFKYNGI